MIFSPLYTNKDDSYEDIVWESRTAEIGSVFKQENVLFPTSWSQRATNIVASKYFHGRGDDREVSLHGLVDRVSLTIYNAGIRLGYFEDMTPADTRTVFHEELQHILINQIASFNSPVWFNIGVEGVAQQGSACFINSVEDDMDSILALGVTEGQIFKRGSGAGVNISRLRGKGEPLSGGGYSSGPVSFMRGLDAQAGTIRSGGVTRRAAKMVIMDDDHPDLMEFIHCKKKEEAKAKALIAAGYDGSIDGEAYGSVFFQNASHSVRLSDDFMNQVKEDISNEGIGPWYARRRTDDEYVDLGSAERILGEIAETAWGCGDPGVQFSDTINKWNTCAKTEAIRGSNPCSEFVFLDNTSCNLASINVLKFWDGENYDIASLRHVVRILITAQDILVGIGDYPTDNIAQMTNSTRPLGLGITNLGALLMTMGLPYDSDEGRDFAAAIMAIITGEAYYQSTVIAESFGAFDLYEENKEPMQRVIEAHKYHAYITAHNIRLRRPGHGGSIHNTEDIGAFWEQIADQMEEVWEAVLERGKIHGFANAQVTAIAPTGTISFMMDCDTTGMEPLLAPRYNKTLVGGGTMEVHPDCYKEAYIDGKQVSDNPVLQTALGDNQLTPMAHLRMVAALQPFVSGAISKTINLPTSASAQDVQDVFIEAWKRGVKCVTVYRNSSKESQPLNVVKKTARVIVDGHGTVEKRTTLVVGEPTKASDITAVDAVLSDPAIKKSIQEHTEAMLRPSPLAALAQKKVGVEPTRRKLDHTRPAVTHKFDIGGHEGYLTIGLYKTGEVAEIFVTMAKEGSAISGLLGSWAMTLSLAIQYGVPLSVLINKHSYVRYEPSGFTGDESVKLAHSITDYIMRWIEANQDSFKEGKDLGKVPNQHPTPLRSQSSKDTLGPTSMPLTRNGNTCRRCNGLLQTQGTCDVCTICGETTGCG